MSADNETQRKQILEAFLGKDSQLEQTQLPQEMNNRSSAEFDCWATKEKHFHFYSPKPRSPLPWKYLRESAWCVREWKGGHMDPLGGNSLGLFCHGCSPVEWLVVVHRTCLSGSPWASMPLHYPHKCGVLAKTLARRGL